VRRAEGCDGCRITGHGCIIGLADFRGARELASIALITQYHGYVMFNDN